MFKENIDFPGKFPSEDGPSTSQMPGEGEDLESDIRKEAITQETVNYKKMLNELFMQVRRFFFLQFSKFKINKYLKS